MSESAIPKRPAGASFGVFFSLFQSPRLTKPDALGGVASERAQRLGSVRKENRLVQNPNPRLPSDRSPRKVSWGQPLAGRETGVYLSGENNKENKQKQFLFFSKPVIFIFCFFFPVFSFKPSMSVSAILKRSVGASFGVFFTLLPPPPPPQANAPGV